MSHPGVWGQGYCCFYVDAVFLAKDGIHVSPTLRDRRLTPAYGQLPRCRLSGESRNPRTLNPEVRQVNASLRATPRVVFPAKAGIHVPRPSGTAGQSILRATPQMPSFRRKPESTYPQPSGTEGCRQPTGNSQSRLSGESRNPRTPTLRDGGSIHPTGNSPDAVFPAKAGIHVSPTLRDRRLPPAYGQLPRCRLSGESRNPRIPNPQGQKVAASLRATPQMSSFRRKPESTYPQP